MKSYKTIKKTGLSEDIIKKSRFICQVKRISSEEEGRNFISQIKKEHHKANHSCSAMIIGENGEIKRSSDDGEPSGTAGVPMLTVLEKQGLTNIVVVVTRYFGGIKLGAGGLIRAYAGSVAKALKEIGIVEIKELQGLAVELTYPQYQTFANFLESQGLQEVDPDFSVTVTTHLFLDKEAVQTTLEDLTDFYHGKVSVQEIGSKVVEVDLIPMNQSET
ncbi:YigZ family protein [Streptococcus cuniculipharyngis]|uniref:YigZ family protein n=1 Tax=Streptococcus cuniculipharyngis TaxID=1562651 RepID=A0A5C5SDR8_9STRE|nr:YigZ family protein [Streptococcus cuniculipharyngis]TWS98093.1 YigZ family protein [Streptococcus cuniculipharyngis]